MWSNVYSHQGSFACGYRSRCCSCITLCRLICCSSLRCLRPSSARAVSRCRVDSCRRTFHCRGHHRVRRLDLEHVRHGMSKSVLRGFEARRTRLAAQTRPTHSSASSARRRSFNQLEIMTRKKGTKPLLHVIEQDAWKPDELCCTRRQRGDMGANGRTSRENGAGSGPNHGKYEGSWDKTRCPPQRRRELSPVALGGACFGYLRPPPAQLIELFEDAKRMPGIFTQKMIVCDTQREIAPQ